MFNKAYVLDNKNTVTLINQSVIMIKKGDYENAVKKCSTVIEIDGTQPEAYFNRGIAYEMLKKTDEACSDWEEAFIMGSTQAEEFINSPTCNE
jgi:Flp pilus assembly protein TadD